MASAIILAAPASGSGKTVLCAGLLAHFRKGGRAVRAFKAGPDYIDPGYHRMASGHDCVNLDPWGMRPETLARRVAVLCADADLVIGEGAMGLFDGARDGTGSTADLAAGSGSLWCWWWTRGARAPRWRRLPKASSITATTWRSRASSSTGWRRGARTAAPQCPRRAIHRGSRCRATVGRAEPAVAPSRPRAGLRERRPWVEDAAAVVARSVDTEALAALARPLQAGPAAPGAAIPPLGQRIAVARDEAFGFCYDALMEDWRNAGATVVPFSPLADEAPDAEADAVYLPGGYPELHAGRIAGAQRFLAGLRAATGHGAVLFGECGGYMVLGRGLIDADGHRHGMAGLLPLETSFQERRLALGYRQARLAADGPLGKAGTAYCGHEFHYCRVVAEDAGRPLFETCDATGAPLGDAGMTAGMVSGSFIHLIDRA
ncbi:Hydrogenobyrinate a,c-diamide synthase [Geodia barretti]|uniref:Hydrogenobyrinate a,c-diamide synthase n=1 Tax=Geodia barretti TaxID=519541 RepID=A0AA35XL90_GEOBA|nr:Hydrogenobyrinate a,c-diamide synthase [Geodia barretti]